MELDGKEIFTVETLLGVGVVDAQQRLGSIGTLRPWGASDEVMLKLKTTPLSQLIGQPAPKLRKIARCQLANLNSRRKAPQCLAWPMGGTGELGGWEGQRWRWFDSAGRHCQT